MAQSTPNIHPKKNDGKLNTRTSIVDYLKSQGQDSSMQARTSLAKKHGINNYKGTYDQNVSLLNTLRNAKTVVPAQPKRSATTQARTTNARATSAPQQRTTSSNSALQQTDQSLEEALNNYKQFLRESTNNYYKNQEASLNTTLNQRLTELEKAYNQAVQEGKMSEQEAQEAFQDNVDAINEEAYLNSQVTELSAQNRGIGNSQQLLAMQQGDQRATQQLMSESRSARDKRINEIKDRIAQITNNYNLDVSQANTEYNNALTQARAQADQMFNSGMSELNMQQYMSYLQTKQQLTIQEQQHLNALEQMAQQQKYTQENMNLQQQLDLEKMSQQYEYDLGKMKTQFGYDIKKMDKQFDQDLAKMAKQYGYDMSKISAQQRNQMAQIKAQQNAAIAQAEAQRKAELNALKNSYLNPSSTEYKVREAQINEANEQAVLKITNEAKLEALTNVLEPGTYAYNKFISDPSYAMKNFYSFTRNGNGTGLTGYTELSPAD